MLIDTKKFECLMNLYNHGYISRDYLEFYFYGEGSSSSIMSNLHGESMLFIPPAVPEIEKSEVEKPEIFETIENRFEILDL